MLKGKGGGSTQTVIGRVSFDRIERPGDILVARMTEPHMLAHMLRAGAVVCDEGGALCHAALICTEMGLPFVVGTKNATKVLTAGMVVAVNPMLGTVEEVMNEPQATAAGE